jgi:alpha-beta hydrolase superfamily lysophospholipase
VAIPAHPAVFGPERRGLFGLHHPPRGGSRGLGALLCNPLGYEAMSAHRTLRHLAERLAARGVAALRFDYDGTGDSAGRADDPGRFAAWLTSIRAAIAELRARAGVQDVALIGLRFGAALAALAASEGLDVEALVLWAPVVSGKNLVRELRAFRLLRDPKAPDPMGRGVEIGGYVFDESTLDTMATVDLLASPRPPARRVLVLSRSDRVAPDETRLAAHLRDSGADVQTVAGTGYGPMMRDDPYDSVVPFPTLNGIVDWLIEGRPLSPPSVVAAPASVPAVLTMTGRHGGVPLRETSIRFGDDRRLFGVLAEPCDPGRAKSPAVLLLNVGADQHVGPHRMNVEHARALASLGHPTFRFDLGGLGESAAAPGAPENRLFSLAAVDDVRAAMTQMERLRCGSRFVVVGLCSGSFVAFHSALADPRVVGQVLFNPFAFNWKEGDPVQREFKATSTYARGFVD